MQLTRAVLALVALLLVSASSAIAAPQFPAAPAPEPVPDQSGSNPQLLRTVLTPSGESVAVWSDFTGSAIRSARRTAAGAWVFERTLFSGALPQQLQMGADATGNVTAAWASGSSVQYAYRPAGGTWGPTVTHPGSWTSELTLAVAPDGRAVLAWMNSSDDVVGVYRAPGAATFGTTEDAISATIDVNLAQLISAATPTGRVVVMWRNVTDEDLDSAVRDAGDSAFGAEATAYGISPRAVEARLAADGVGNVHLLFATSQEGPDRVDIWGKMLPAGASSFTATEQVTYWTGTTNPAWFALAAAPDGTATAFWVRPGGIAASSTRPPGGAYTDPDVSTPPDVAPDASRGYKTTLVSGPDGSLVATWLANSDQRPMVMTRTPGGAWSAPRTLDTAIPLEVTVAVGASGDAIATWSRQFQTGGASIFAAAGDSGAAPRVSLTAPASLLAGQSGAFGLAATDFSGISSSSLAFGDGATASGTSAAHAYAGPGTFGVTGTAVDGRGNTTSATATVGVTPLAGTPQPPATRRRTRGPDTNIDRVPRRVRASRLRRFTGRATDELGLRSVEIALVRLRGGTRFTALAAARRCDALRITGRLRRTTVRRGRCAPRTFLRATGTRRWSFRLKRRLPRGSYVLVSRARAADGTVERGFSTGDRNLVRFRVR